MKEINLIQIINPETGNVMASHQFYPSKEIKEADFKDIPFKLKDETRGGYPMSIMEIVNPDVNIMDVLKIIYT